MSIFLVVQFAGSVHPNHQQPGPFEVGYHPNIQAPAAEVGAAITAAWCPPYHVCPACPLESYTELCAQNHHFSIQKIPKASPFFYQNNIYTSSMAHPQCLATACCFQLAQEGLAGRHLGFDVLIKLPSHPISQVDHGWSIWSIPTSPSSIHIPWHSAQGPTWRWNSRVNTGLESWDESMEICGRKIWEQRNLRIVEKKSGKSMELWEEKMGNGNKNMGSTMIKHD